MVRIRQHQGKLDGVEFLHGNPALTLVRATPEAMRLLEDMGLIPFLQGLTEEADLPLVLQAKRSYNVERTSITITTPQGNLQEILLSSDVVHYALRLPAVGTIMPTTKEIKQMCQPYFTNLLGQHKDGYPLANVTDPHIRLVAEAISSHIEVSRAERRNQIHARFFCPIHLFLHHQELVHWANLVYEELRKGLKSTRDFIAFGPHLTQIISWCLANPGVHLGLQHHIPQPPPVQNPEPLQVLEPEIDFNPQAAEDINLSDFINDNIQFADTEHSGNLRPSGTANPADIEEQSQRDMSEENRRREIERKEQADIQERQERERNWRIIHSAGAITSSGKMPRRSC
jgi:hypothetical protein